MKVEFARLGIEFECQKAIGVVYKDKVVGNYVADFLIGDVIVEIKAKASLDSFDEAQLLNYLKGTGKKIGLLFNFGPEASFKRRVF